MPSVDEHKPVAADPGTAGGEHPRGRVLVSSAEPELSRGLAWFEEMGSEPESRALVAAVGSGILGFLAGIILMWGRETALFSSGRSIALVAVFVCLITGGSSYVWSMAKTQPNTAWFGAIPHWRRGLGRFALVVTHLAITLFAVTGAFAVLGLAFVGLTLPTTSSAALVAVAAVLAGYANSLSGNDMSTMNLATLLTMFMASGTLAAMLTSSDPGWWTHHFSYLGGGGAGGIAFNGTLIVGGLVLIVLADRLTYDLGTSPRTKGADTKLVRGLLVAAGVFCGLTGVLPFDVYEPVHASFAGCMLLTMVALMALVPSRIPNLPAAFRPASYALIGVPVASIVLFLVGAFSWTGVELVSALGVFAWLVVFVRAIVSTTGDVDKTPTH